MEDIWIVIGIFLFSIIVAVIIKWILNKEDEKIITKEQVKAVKEKPDLTIFDNIDNSEIKKLLKSYSKQEKTIPLGWNEKQEVEVLDLNQIKNLLIIGTTGGGKSICLNEIITSITMTYQPEDLKIVTMDTSMVELSSFNGIPHYLKDTLISPKDIIEELEEIQKEVQRRNSDSKTPLIILIDDLYDICSYDEKVLPTIESLLEKSKSKNIYLILATDTPAEEIITEQIKKQIDGTIYLTLSPGEKKDFELDLTKSDIEKLTEIGSAIYKTNNSKKKLLIPEILESEIQAIKDYYKK